MCIIQFLLLIYTNLTKQHLLMLGYPTFILKKY
jgi:hypothetical protein